MMTSAADGLSEPGSKNQRGRPPAFPQEYLRRLQGYYQRLGKSYDGRSLVNKAYMLRAMEALYPLLDDLPALRYLMNHETGELKETLMTRLGRIRDEDELLDVAMAVSVFKADKECDFAEVRKAWEVLLHVLLTSPESLGIPTSEAR